MKHNHYKKDVRHLKFIDVYRVCELFEVNSQPVGHAIKKLLCAGQRGAKDYEQDLREAVDSVNRALQMIAEDCNKAAQEGVAQNGQKSPEIRANTDTGGGAQAGIEERKRREEFAVLHHKLFGRNERLTALELSLYWKLAVSLGVPDSGIAYINSLAPVKA